MTPASATPPPVVAPAPAPTAGATTASSSSPPTTPVACPPGVWQPPTTLSGKATRASGQNARMESEKYIALELATPVCGPAGQKIARVQLIPMGTTTYASLAKLEGKSITVVGTASTAMTAHHHEDVVFDVQKVE